MKKAILGTKVGMTQIFDENGKVIPVTVVQAGPCVVVQKKTTENDGYEAVQIGYGDISDKNASKPKKGHFAKNDLPVKRHLREFKLDDCGSVQVGDVLKPDIFEVGDIVDVCGTSKGKGYSGTVKRYGFRMQKASHGGGPIHRHIGSLGSSASPGRVAKGTKLPGQMGNQRVTIQNLDVVKIDAENNLIALRGAVPGPKGGLVAITSSVKKA